jgi:hypothetical protein
VNPLDWLVLYELGYKTASDSGAWQRAEGKNPEGGLNAKGRASLRAQGHDIKPGVKGPADTPEKMKRRAASSHVCSAPAHRVR